MLCAFVKVVYQAEFLEIGFNSFTAYQNKFNGQ